MRLELFESKLHVWYDFVYNIGLENTACCCYGVVLLARKISLHE